MTQAFTHGYALLIGVDASQVDRWALPAVAKDIAAVAEVLAHPERCGYPAANVKTLTGPAATRAGLLDGLTWLGERLHADVSGNATAVIYYSGHGWRSADDAYYLLPYDARETTSRLPQPASALPATDFASMVSDLAPRRLLVILDCCHAGGMGVKDAAGFAGVALPPAVLMASEEGVVAGAKGLETLAQGAGRAVLSSSQGHQPSYMRRDGKMSIFTYHLIEALTGHAQPAEGATEVLVSDVMSHVWRRVPVSARADAGKDQQPDFQVSGNFPVALLLGGQGVGKGVTPPDPLALLSAAGPAIQQALTGRGVQVSGDQTIHGDQVLGDKIGRQVNTGGGAYVEGDVRTEGGDFVGRDRITAQGGSAVGTGGGVAFVGDGNTVITGKVGGDVRVGSQSGGGSASRADFLALVAQIRQQVATLASPADRAEAAAELDKVAELAQRAAPPGGRIGRALDNVAEIAAGDRTAAALVARASRMAQTL